MQNFSTVTSDAVQMTLISDPIVALAAALVGALIAYLVAKSLARQQRAADDKRQWDKDLKGDYLTAREHLEVIRSSKGLTANSTEVATAAVNMTLALEKLRRLRLSMSLTASTKSLEALDEVLRRATTIRDDAVSGAPLLPIRESALDTADEELFASIKKDLRIKV